MLNFTIKTPTEVVFGRGIEEKIGERIKEYGAHRVLVHFGGASARSSGLLDRVEHSLFDAGLSFVELGGVSPNPKISLVRKGVALCRREGLDFVLAVGGGSVIDSAKAIAMGAATGRDPWEFASTGTRPDKTLPVATVLTLAASGSETSNSCVLTNEETKEKRGITSETNRPVISFLNPENTFTVSKFQTGCGIVDIMMHTLERYFSLNGDTPLTDNLDEGLLRTVAEAGKRAIADPEDYEARAALMWAGSLSHNGLTGCGKNFVMRCHQLEHELSGAYDRVAHGAGLSVIFPAWAKYIYQYNVPRFARYAANVWGIPMDFEHPERTALAGIEAAEAYFRSIGMPVRLSELDVDDTKFDEMAEKCTFFGKRTLPDYIELGKKEMLDIYRLCL